jgi:MFS family permease
MRSLYLLVFTAGLVTLGMEISAARLLEPAFGNSQIVWTALIGLILLALAVGAWLGGMLADRYPRRRELHLVLTAAGLAVALVPLVSQPVLRLAATGLADFAPGLLAGALAAVTLLFALPAILLGTATPWAVRIAVGEEEGKELSIVNSQLSIVNEDAPHPNHPITQSPNHPNTLQPYHSLGTLAGRFSALATAGSLIGAFLPVLWLIPTFGTRWTFYLLALLLLAVVSASALRESYRWVPLAGLAAVLLLAFFTQPAGVRAAWDDDRSGTLIYEDESQFNYIAVRQWGSERHLKLNEGIGIHSVYHPDARLSQGIWDYFLLAPLFRSGEWRAASGDRGMEIGDASPHATRHSPISDLRSPVSSLQSPVSNLLLIGAAAGTVPGLYTDIYGAVPITGVELDPQIVQVGQEYFGAAWPNYTAVAADGRQWLARQGSDVKFDVIAVDAYRPPYIPFHLTTVEFFELVRRHLDEDGVLAINVGRAPANNALVDALAATLAVVFPTVFVVDEPGPPDTLANSLVVATVQPATIEAFRARVDGLPAELPAEFREFAARTVTQTRVAAPAPDAPVFTDDRSPVEQLVHGIIADFVLQRVPAAP